MKTYEEIRSLYPDLLACGFECQTGWADLIEAVLKNIQLAKKYELYTIDPDFKFVQIKEKFGELRMYRMASCDYIDGLVNVAATMSLHVCECCGAPGKVRGDRSWIQTLCDEHNQNPGAQDGSTCY